MALATTGTSSMAVVNGDLEIQDATLNINSLAGFGTGNYELIAFTTVGSDNLSLGSGTSSDFNYLIVDEANSIWLDVTPAAVTPVGPLPGPAPTARRGTSMPRELEQRQWCEQVCRRLRGHLR